MMTSSEVLHVSYCRQRSSKLGNSIIKEINRNTIFIKFDNAYSSKNLYRSSHFIHIRMLEVLIVVVGNSLCVESKEKDTQIFSLYLPSFHVKGMPHKRHHQQGL